MNSAVSSGTHHIFFPPRLQAACRQRYPSSLASHPVGDSAFHSLLGAEPHCPPSPTQWRWTAHHRDDRRVLGAVQQPRRRRSRILPERRLPSSLSTAAGPWPPTREAQVASRAVDQKPISTASADAISSLRSRH